MRTFVKEITHKLRLKDFEKPIKQVAKEIAEFNTLHDKYYSLNSLSSHILPTEKKMVGIAKRLLKRFDDKDNRIYKYLNLLIIVHNESMKLIKNNRKKK